MARTRTRRNRSRKRRHRMKTCRRRNCKTCKMMGGKKRSYGLVLKGAIVPALMVVSNAKYPTMTKLRKTLRRVGIRFKNTELRRSSFTRKRKRSRTRRRR